jgi:addiction module RelE/StbE family toxin
MRIKWLKRALENLEAEAAYIAQENPKAAGECVNHILSAVQQLARHPNIGRAGRVFGTRELVITRYPYIVPYRIKNETIEVLRIFHTSRKWPNQF